MVGPMSAFDHERPSGTCRIQARDAGTLVALGVYPVKGEPGRSLQQGTLTDAGLLGDRHKRHALLVTSAADVAEVEARGEELRANIVVDVDPQVLAAATGRELRLGGTVIRIEARSSGCQGMYAEVVEPGDVLVGDDCRFE